MPIRPAIAGDIPQILELIRNLAEYEKALHEVRASEKDLIDSLFCQNPQVFAHVATEDGQVVGVAIWYLNYSTWLGKHGIYLEDLFVLPQHRGSGHGFAMLRHLAQICLDRGYERLQWWVLDWNQPAINFYKSLGAIPMDEWTVYRATGDALEKMAAANSPANNP